MPTSTTIGAFAIIPSNNLPGAVPFWERLGFTRAGGDTNYIIMTGLGCEVHLTQAGNGPLRCRHLRAGRLARPGGMALQSH